MRSIAVSASVSTSIATSGIGRTPAITSYARPQTPSGRYATAMTYLTKITSSWSEVRITLIECRMSST